MRHGTGGITCSAWFMVAGSQIRMVRSPLGRGEQLPAHHPYRTRTSDPIQHLKQICGRQALLFTKDYAQRLQAIHRLKT